MQKGEERSLEFRTRLSSLDRDAMSRFYELFAGRVYHFVRRMLGEDHLAEDVTQDIFIHMQKSLPSYDPARELSPWVFTIATNKVRDFWRSRRHSDLQHEQTLEPASAAEELATLRGAPLPVLEKEEQGRILSQAIEALPEGLKITVLLRLFEGLSFESIASILERNEDAIRKRYSRALAELRRSLDKLLRVQEGGLA